MANPCVLITSCSAFKTTELIKLILSVDVLPTSANNLENILSYPWHIDTKYYTADVDLCITEERTVGNEAFAKAVQAFVAVFDTTQLATFDKVKMWLPYLKEISPPVKLLVCDHCSETDAISRHDTLVWCLDNEFELVELNPIETDDGSDEGESERLYDFKETLGVQRIVEALRCHSWPNMVLKENPTFRSEYFQKLMNDTAMANASSPASNPSGEHVEVSSPISNPPGEHASAEIDDAASNNVKESNAGEKTDAEKDATDAEKNSLASASAKDILDSLLGENDGNHEMDDDSFEKLFEKLHVMKEAASGMPLDRRKKYAEDVVLQFWKAIGGSDDEIEGLSDADDP